METIAAAPVRAHRVFYGWWVLAVAAAAMVGTLPGRTQGLGLITEPLLADLGLDRVTYAQINFWATVLGSVGAIGIGRALDRFGSRTVLTVVAVALGVVVCFMSQTETVAGLSAWATLTRALGQSALSVISLAMVGQWFVRGIDTAMAVYSMVMSVGFMMAFPAVGAAIQHWGWRAAWLSIGLALIIGLAPLAYLVVRVTPEAMGLAPDGEPLPPQGHVRSASTTLELEGYDWRAALRTSAFWMFAIGAALYGLVASGIGLFNESILNERGFGVDVYYQSLVVTAMTALAGNFLGGWLARRVRLPSLLAAALAILALGLAVLPLVSSVTHVILWATAMGLGGGLVMVLFFSVWARVYGRRHLGRIQGMAQAMTVLASALGPLLLAWWIDRTGSYAAMFRILAAVVGLTAIGALVTPMPAADRILKDDERR
ncbi:MAG TPA: MFS transporter [Vicinamibacterales bacterium]|nr:MFS transporter [Vicinamibacterales bacterium]